MALLAPPPDIYRVARPAIDFGLGALTRAYLRGARWPRYTSWWRSVAANRAEGGGDVSQHLVGLAWDLGLPVARVDLLRAEGLTVIEESDHVHVQVYPAGVASAFVRALRR